MITFRFYVVSVVAFFLAIAVGVVLGSALDGRISDSLKDRLERVESNLDATVDVMDEKNDQIERLNTFADEVMAYSVEGRLTGTNTLVVAQSGIEPDQVARVLRAVGAAGSATPGVMWVEKAWDPADRKFTPAVRSVLEAHGSAVGPAGPEDAIWNAVLDMITPPVEQAPETPPDTTPDTTPEATHPDTVDDTDPGEGPKDTGDPTNTPTTAGDDAVEVPSDGSGEPTTTGPLVQEWWTQPLMKDLAGSSLIKLHSSGQVEGDPAPLNIVVIIGGDSVLRNDDSEMVSLVKAAATRGIPVVVAEVGSGDDADSDDERLGLPEFIRSVDAGLLSAIQGADQVGGDTAVVGALANAARGEFGVFGTGRLATSVLPPLLGDDGGP